MKIIVEEYQYPVEAVRDILWKDAFQTVDGKVSINYVGYYFNPRKEVNDCVFILPKMLLEDGPDGKDLVFGKYAPESIVDMDASSPLTTGEREFISVAWRPGRRAAHRGAKARARPRLQARCANLPQRRRTHRI